MSEHGQASTLLLAADIPPGYSGDVAVDPPGGGVWRKGDVELSGRIGFAGPGDPRPWLPGSDIDHPVAPVGTTVVRSGPHPLPRGEIRSRQDLPHRISGGTGIQPLVRVSAGICDGSRSHGRPPDAVRQEDTDVQARNESSAPGGCGG